MLLLALFWTVRLSITRGSFVACYHRRINCWESGQFRICLARARSLNSDRDWRDTEPLNCIPYLFFTPWPPMASHWAFETLNCKHYSFFTLPTATGEPPHWVIPLEILDPLYMFNNIKNRRVKNGSSLANLLSFQNSKMVVCPQKQRINCRVCYKLSPQCNKTVY